MDPAPAEFFDTAKGRRRGNNNIQDVRILDFSGAPDGGSSSFGVAGARFTSGDASGSVADVTDAPTTDQKLVITDIRYSSDTALRLDFIDKGNSDVLFSEYVGANSGGQITLRSKLKLSTVNAKLGVQASGAGNIAVTAAYYSEA